MPLPANYEGLLGCEVREMTQDESILFMQATLAEEDAQRAAPDYVAEEMAKDHGYQIITKRMAAHGVRTTLMLKLFLVTISENPAHLVLWVYTLAHIQAKNPGSLVTIHVWGDHFPDGVPTKGAYDSVWGAQKRSSEDGPNTSTDNWLDYHVSWPPLARAVEVP